MEFEPGHLYHVFNRGNNSQRVFFTPANYLFFLEKIKKGILPYADILAWCLMPNHFHLMINVTGGVTEQVTENSHQLRGHRSPPLSKPSHIPEPLNASIGNILASYTRAIQRQEKRTGSLFQGRTKAICLTRINGISPCWFPSPYGAIINVSFPEKEYPQVCFNYIHDNPVKGGLANVPQGWAFSSARDYAGARNGTLINKDRVKEFGLEFNLY